VIVNARNGNPVVVFPTEQRNKRVVREFDAFYKTPVYTKTVPLIFSGGSLFASPNTVGELPFSFYALQGQTNSSELTFKYNPISKKLYDVNNKNNILYMPSDPNKTEDAVVPSSLDSTHLDEINLEIWTKDKFEIKNIKISNTYGMSFGDLHTPVNTYNLPSFTWEHNTYLSSYCFSILRPNGNLSVLKYTPDSDKNKITITKTSSCLLEGSVLLYGFTGMLYGEKTGNILVTTPDIVMSINGSTLKISDAINLANVKLYCCDNNGDSWGILNNKNMLKMEPDLTYTAYDVISYPNTMVYSTYHQSVFSLGNNIVYRFNTVSLDLSIVEQTGTNTFKDMDIYKTGMMAILSQVSSENYTIKLFNPDLTLNKIFSITNETVLKIMFSAQGNLFYLSEKDNNSKISSLDTQNGGSQTIAFAKVTDPRLLYYSGLQTFFIFGTNGSISMCPDVIGEDTEVTLLYKSKINFNQVSYAPVALSSKTLEQTKIRVFVGSEMGKNDRWDSGEISTSKTKILYGGGDNLEEGQKYFVHIMVY